MFKKLMKVLIIVFIVLAIIFPVIAPALLTALGTAWPILSGIVTGLGALSPWLLGAAAIGISYALFPDTTSEIISDVGEVVGKVVETGVAVVGKAVSAVTGGIWPWLAVGAGVFLLTRDDNSDDAAGRGSAA